MEHSRLISFKAYSIATEWYPKLVTVEIVLMVELSMEFSFNLQHFDCNTLF